MEELRQVEIIIKYPLSQRHFDEEPKKDKIILGYFHGWEDYKTEDFSCKFAIIELEDGKIEKFEPTQIKFTGEFYRKEKLSKEQMDEYLKM